jgi:hypothetical protein
MDYLMQFQDRMRSTFEDLLNPFFTSETLDDMVHQLPRDMMDSTRKIFETWCIFFRDIRNYQESLPHLAQSQRYD